MLIFKVPLMFGDFTYCNLWILLRIIVIYLVVRKVYLHGLFAVKVDGSDVIVGTPECLNIQTRHKFENFCLFSLNSTYLIQNQVRYFQYVYNCVFSLWADFYYDVTSVDFNSKKVREDKIFGRQDTLQFFAGVFKDYKYVKSPNMR